MAQRLAPHVFFILRSTRRSCCNLGLIAEGKKATKDGPMQWLSSFCSEMAHHLKQFLTTYHLVSKIMLHNIYFLFLQQVAISLCGPFKNLYLICYNIVSALFIYFFGPKAHAILGLQPRIEPTPLELEDEVFFSKNVYTYLLIWLCWVFGFSS